MKTITIKDDCYEWFTEAIAEMKRLYAIPDDGHIADEYQNADDIARDVAEVLGDIIEKQDGSILHEKRFEFERYMTGNRWDSVCAEGIYADEGERAVGAFIEFCETGKVTDDDGKELVA